jgi:hypothetical protein
MPGEDAKCFRTAYAQFVQMLKFICRMYPEKGTLAVGSLHTSIACHYPVLPGVTLSPPWIKFSFSEDSLPPRNSSAQVIISKYFFKSMAAEALEVVQTSAIRRDKVTLAAASNTGAYNMSSEDKRAQAWRFISRGVPLFHCM